VMKLVPSTESPTLYKLPPDSGDLSFLEFSVTPEGTVSFLEEGIDGHFVFRFDSDGKVKERIRLDTPKNLSPERFAMTENGVAMLSDDEAPRTSRGKGYAAIFNPSGELRKELKGSGEDVDLGSVGKSVPAGDVSVGSNGNFFFLRSKDVLVISQSGDTRTIQFEKPDPTLTPREIQLSDGLISIVLRKHDKQGNLTWNSLILDDPTGELTGFYAVPPEAGNISVCFTRKDGYIFERVENGNIKLLTVPLR
jgi:hypothetical protein